MSKLTFGDLDLGLANLFGPRKAALEASVSGKLYGPMLAKKHAAILALPEPARSKAPYAEELALVDAEHDRLGGGILSYLDAVEQSPILSEATRGAAKRVRQAFIPHRSALTDSYAEEAAAAKKNREKIGDHEADLKLFPVPEGKTLLDWVNRFLDAGDALDKLLHQRALAISTTTPGSIGKLRGDTIGLLYQFRATLRAEIDDNADLPRDLEAQVFGYLDELDSRRRSVKAKPEAAPPAEGKPTGG